MIAIIAFWSQRFSDVETRYSQFESESLAVVLCLERFRLYLIGTEFELYCDNKAVEVVLNNPRSNPPLRVARMFLRLQAFRFVVFHKPGKYNMADYLSRNPVSPPSNGQIALASELYLYYIETTNLPKALQLRELIEATKVDSTLQKVILMVHEGDFDKCDADTKAYAKHAYQLSVSHNGILLRGTQAVIPDELQLRVSRYLFVAQVTSTSEKNTLPVLAKFYVSSVYQEKS